MTRIDPVTPSASRLLETVFGAVDLDSTMHGDGCALSPAETSRGANPRIWPAYGLPAVGSVKVERAREAPHSARFDARIRDS